jgi:hypothetical protein
MIASADTMTCTRPSPEDVAPQLPKPRWLEFKPDDEQQQHHTQFGEMQDFLAIGNDPEQGADDNAGGEIAENRPEPDFLEQRRRHNRSAQQHEAFGVKGGFDCSHSLRSFDVKPPA